jgi:hypothetical protein
MIDRKTEADIRTLGSFLEFWTKFHSIFDEAVSKDIISNDDEGRFLGVRDIIRSKYEALRSSLDFKYSLHSRVTDPVDEVLAISGIRLMSEKALRKLNDDWRDSYVFLNGIMERLKNKRRRLQHFNPVAVYFKRLFENKAELLRKACARGEEGGSR